MTTYQLLSFRWPIQYSPNHSNRVENDLKRKMIGATHIQLSQWLSAKMRKRVCGCDPRGRGSNLSGRAIKSRSQRGVGFVEFSPNAIQTNFLNNKSGDEF